jgi:hypothetical protein
MARRRAPPSRGWKTFLRNHADGIVAVELSVVPIISFQLLYGLLIMGMARGRSCGLSLNEDAPISRDAEAAGRIICRPILSGLHHQCVRI